MHCVGDVRQMVVIAKRHGVAGIDSDGSPEFHSRECLPRGNTGSCRCMSALEMGQASA